MNNSNTSVPNVFAHIDAKVNPGYYMNEGENESTPSEVNNCLTIEGVKESIQFAFFGDVHHDQIIEAIGINPKAKDRTMTREEYKDSYSKYRLWQWEMNNNEFSSNN